MDNDDIYVVNENTELVMLERELGDLILSTESMLAMMYDDLLDACKTVYQQYFSLMLHQHFVKTRVLFSTLFGTIPAVNDPEIIFSLNKNLGKDTLLFSLTEHIYQLNALYYFAAFNMLNASQYERLVNVLSLMHRHTVKMVRLIDAINLHKWNEQVG